MATHDRSRRQSPGVERLEGRRLLSASSSYYANLAYNARHEYDRFVSEVQAIELQSAATPAQFLALRDDARTISEAASTTTLTPKTAASRAAAASLQIDRSLLHGSLSDQAWAEEKTHLERDLDGLNVPQAVVDRTIADETSAALSAGVTSDQYLTLTGDLNRARQDRHNVPSGSGYGHFPDPALFYTQHLRGFFRGWAVQRTTDEAGLASDLTTISTAASAAPADVAALNRDVTILKALGAPIPSADSARILNAFTAAFSQGSPTAPRLAVLRGQIVSALGPTATPSRLAAVDRLIADTPAFFRALGSSPANVRTIADDVQAVIEDGAGQSLNPFRITVRGAQ